MLFRARMACPGRSGSHGERQHNPRQCARHGSQSAVSAFTESRYALFPLFVAGVFFMLAAPLFWMQVDAPQGKPELRSRETAVFYQRVAPAAVYGFDRLRARELPLWNDRQLCGTAHLSDPANGVFQPVNAVFLFMPAGAAFAVHAFTCIFLMGLLFVLFGRALGLRYVSAMAGGAVYTFCGASAAAMSRPEMAATLAWAPLLFWAIAEQARAPRAGAAVMGGAAAALMLLAGSPAVSAVFLALAVPFAVVKSLWPGGAAAAAPRNGSAWRGFALMALVGLGLSAVQWMPSLTWLLQLDRPWEALWRADLAGTAPQSWKEMLAHLVAPRPDLLPRVGYLGAAALVFIPAAFLHRGRRAEILFFTLAAVALAALGIHGMRRWEGPFPWQLFFLPASFAAATLTALGIDRLFMSRRDARTPRFWSPLLLAIAVAGVVFWLSPPETKGRLLPALAAILFFALFRGAWAGALGGVLVMLVLFIDLAAASANFHERPYRSGMGASDAVVRAAREQALDGRVFVSTHPLNAAVMPNIGMVSPLRAAGGCFIPLAADQARWWEVVAGVAKESPDGAVPESGTPAVRADAGPSSMDIHADADAPQLINFMAVRTVLATADGGLGAGGNAGLHLRRLMPDVDGVTLYGNDAALPRVFLVDRWRVAPEVVSAASVMTDKDFAPLRECVVLPQGDSLNYLAVALPEGRGGREKPADGAVLGNCVIETDAAERVAVKVDSPRPAILVLADTAAPGWRAQVNGTSTPLLKVNGLFRGVVVPSGASTVTFVYRPVPFYAGAVVTGMALVLLVLAGMTALVRLARRAE